MSSELFCVLGCYKSWKIVPVSCIVLNYAIVYLIPVVIFSGKIVLLLVRICPDKSVTSGNTWLDKKKCQKSSMFLGSTFFTQLVLILQHTPELPEELRAASF